jgi:hypothetical protein
LFELEESRMLAETTAAVRLNYCKNNNNEYLASKEKTT